MTGKFYKQIFIAGIIFYLFMLALSLIFYKERTILLDTSYALFHILKENTFSIEFHRFGDTLVQLLPLLASRLNCSLSTIMKLYSISFVIYFFFCYLLTGLVLKKYDFALIILLINSLFVTDTFYYTPSQLPQGMCFMLLLFAFLSAKNEIFKQNTFTKLIITIFVFFSVVMLAFFHPLILFALTFTLIFFTLHNILFINRKLLLLVVFTYILTSIFKAIFLRTIYENQALSGLKNFLTKFPDYLHLFSNKHFLISCISKYYWIPIFFLSINIFYFKSKAWAKLLFFSSFFTAYLLLINISYPDKTTPQFYIENLYLPLALILAVPFVFDILPWLITKKLALPLVILILISGCIRIYESHGIFSARVIWERQTIKKYGKQKVIINTKDTPMDTLMMVWGTPYEFWLLSTSETDTAASIIIDAFPEKQLWFKNYKKHIYVNWCLFDYKDFPKNQYFRFRDTSTGYIIIPHSVN